MSQQPDELIPPLEDVPPATRGPRDVAWHHPSRMRGMLAVAVVVTLWAVFAVLTVRLFQGELTTSEYFEIIGPIIVGVASGVFGYYFKATDRG